MKTLDNQTKINNKSKIINTKDLRDEAKKSIIEVGGPKGKEPTRYGDWEKNGRCTDF